MEEKDFLFPEEIYSAYLISINEIHFTHREIDIIACLLNARGTSKIAFLLSISPRTVVTHIRNIMLKLECNSREGIIDFVEKSHKVSLLREYYLALIAKITFEKGLKELAKLKRERGQNYFIIHWKCEKLKNSLLRHLEPHLRLMGIYTKIHEQDVDQKIEVLEKVDQVFVLLIEKDNFLEISNEFSQYSLIDLSEQIDYYLSVLEILKIMFPQINIDKKIIEFAKTLAGYLPITENSSLNTPTSINNELQKSAAYLQPHSSILRCDLESVPISTNLILPFETAFLDRHKCIVQIEKFFKDEDENIQTLALVGPGGAGKTTLARQYALKHKTTLIWEVNSETRKNLICSFEKFAHTISKTEQEKEELRKIYSLTAAEEKEERIFLYVQEKLRQHPNWIIIYDNVENFKDIQNYFPHHLSPWGKGKVIVTTRNSTIQNNIHIAQTFYVRELDDKEKLALFLKIVNFENEEQLNSVQKDEVERFLYEIPSFPLDISIAAYYLKATDSPYSRYLEHLQKYCHDFIAVQERIVKEASNYTQNRYGIITLSLQHIINAHKDFQDLLLFISLLDSQNIPRDLLDQYKNKTIVDDFIYNLKKHSFITNETLSFFNSSASLSIHRSTQAIILAYFTKTLDLKRNHKFLESITDLLENYMINIINELVNSGEGFLRMKSFVCHYEMFLNHKTLITESQKGRIEAELGCIYFYLSYYTEAKKKFDDSLKILRKCNSKYLFKFARISTYLGDVYRKLGNYEKAKELLEQTLTTYQQQFPNAFVYIGWTLALLGKIYADMGDFKKAENYLNQSLLVYKKCFPTNHLSIGWVLSILGYVYGGLEEHEKSRNLLEGSLAIYERDYGNDHVESICILLNLGRTYLQEDNLETAEGYFHQAYSILHKMNHPNLVFVFENFAELYLKKSSLHINKKKIKQLERSKAINYLNQALDVIKDHFPPDSPHITRIETKLKKVEKEIL